MMYYRRKILLALIQQFGGSLSQTDLQKLLFLFCQRQSIPAYHFIPYKFGCFSYQSYQDISTLTKYNIVNESNRKCEIIDKNNYINQLTLKDRISLIQFYNEFKEKRGNELIKYVYLKYPYYAINSEIKDLVLDVNQIQWVNSFKPKKNDYTLFTIGYEGKAVEEYVNQLISEDIKVLCDVRKNPLSMKYGFSKNQLKKIVESVGIKYLHFPELGIESDKRQNLKTKDDYKALFLDYELNTLPNKTEYIQNVCDVFVQYKRIALTCFEADFKDCHRSRLAKVISTKFDDKFNIKNI